MSTIFEILYIVIIAIIIFIDYRKDRKFYKLLALLACTVPVFLDTPVAKGVNGILKKGITAALTINVGVMVYLAVKEKRKIKK